MAGVVRPGKPPILRTRLALPLLHRGLPALEAAGWRVTVADELPVRIGRRMALLNRVGPNGVGEAVGRELEGLTAERLPDVPQDDEVERAGAAGEDVFSLPGDNPALVAVREVVEVLRAAPSVAAGD